MKRFVRLFERIDRTTRTNEKVAALVDYFAATDPADAAWVVAVLTGRKITRAVSSRLLRDLACEQTHLPAWLLGECYDAVGDLSETLALLLPETERGTDESLSELIEHRILPLDGADQQTQAKIVRRAWADLSTPQRFLYHKMISTNFRVGVSRKLVVRALAEVAGVDAGVVAHRLSGRWTPSAEAYRRLIDPDVQAAEPGRPYPFCLAHQLDDPPATLGPVEDWQIEWKWDGIRAQLIHRNDHVLLWSRGDELIAPAFPEIVRDGRLLPEGTVLDGEVLAWADDRPLPFAKLQRRLNRKSVQPSFWPEVPVAFVAYDLLEAEGQDQRDRPTVERRQRLEALFERMPETPGLVLSPVLKMGDWDEAERWRQQSRDRGVEGLMLKRRDAPYGVGRTAGLWWKLKIEPYRLDMVMVAAQLGHGRRASLYTDYTFAVRHAGELVTVTKAYSGLTDDEIAQVDHWVRRHTLDRRGPVRIVEPVQVFELAFEGIQPSSRHKAGLALRFPRIARWRQDKSADQADELATLQQMLERRQRAAEPVFET